MNKAVEILIQKLFAGNNAEEQSAEALISQAEKYGKKLDEVVPQLVPSLSNANFRVRAAIANALGNIGTSSALSAMQSALLSTNIDELYEQCAYSCFADEPFYYWLIDGISVPENKRSAKVLVSIVLSPELPEEVRALAMTRLSYSSEMEEYELDFPDNMMDILEEFSSSSNPNVAEGAVRLLGKM